MKVAPDVRESVNSLLEKTKETLSSLMGIEYLELAKDRMVARMPVDNRTKQPFGILHGGASVVLAESLASVGARLNIDEKRFTVVGIEINANHLRSVSSGYVCGVATPIHRGSKTQVWQIEIHEEATKKPICISRCTLAVLPITEK